MLQRYLVRHGSQAEHSRAVHMVALPEREVDDQFEAPGLPRPLIIGRQDLTRRPTRCCATSAEQALSAMPAAERRGWLYVFLDEGQRVLERLVDVEGWPPGCVVLLTTKHRHPVQTEMVERAAMTCKSTPSTPHNSCLRELTRSRHSAAGASPLRPLQVRA